MDTKYFEIFDNFIDGVMIYGPDRKLIYANQAMANVIGTNLKRLKQNTPITQYLTLKNSGLFFMDEGTDGRDSPGQYVEVDFQSSKGNSGKMLVMVRPYLEIDGKMTYLSIFRDMTLEVKLHEKYHAELLEKESVNIELRKAKVELEQYSKNLEVMVQERTKELEISNQFITAMVNSLDQGLVVFNDEGVCLPNYTHAFCDLFDVDPEGKKIWDILSGPDLSVDTLKTWAAGIFEEIIPFKEYAALGPNKLIKNDRYIKIDYFPLRAEDETLMGVVTVATDKTAEQLAEIELKKNRDFVQMVLKLIQNKEQFLAFVSDSKRLIQDMEGSLQSLQQGKNTLNDLLRHLHSIKGSAGIFNIYEVQEMAHNYETELAPYKDLPPEDMKSYLPRLEENIHSLSSKLKEFYVECSSFLGKSVIDGEVRVEITRTRLKELAKRLDLNSLEPSLREEFEDIFFKTPIFKYFTSYSDLIQTMAKEQGKLVSPLIFEGGEIKVKGEHYQELFSTLVHAFTNAVDHGLELPEYRTETGKDPKGKIQIRFQKIHSGPQKFIQIDIQDDGKGIDLKYMREKIKDKGFHPNPDKLSDHQVYQFVFAPNFSTKTVISKTSGRGVGADAIKAQVEKMGGMVEMNSTPGKGTVLSLIFPEIN